MEKTITIKFSTGKEIQLTESEYEELTQEFTQRRGMEIPKHPIHHQYFPAYDTGSPWVVNVHQTPWVANVYQGLVYR